MFRYCLAAVLALILLPSGAAGLSKGRPAGTVIVLVDRPSLPEKKAAEDLSAYLSRITGIRFRVVSEANAPKKGCIYLGPTRFARSRGIVPERLDPEEWVMRSVGSRLILAGGRPRGTLYAVYRFLEDEMGVRWWNPHEEAVPRKADWTIKPINRRGKPVIRYRDIYLLYANDGGRFAARSRLNRQGDTPIAKEFGGSMDYGPPYHVHTFFMYIPPDRYFKDHPEWFSLVGGKRSADQTQLCLTNRELRRAFLRKLIDYIERSRAAARKAGLPAPVVFDVSQNDWEGPCRCEDCQAIARAEGSEAGPLLEFVNFLADSIREKHPEVFLDTLAYMHTQKAPKYIRPRPNVIIRLCDTGSNFTRAITDPENKAFRQHLLSWAKIAQNLRIWDYAVSYAPYYGLPMPTVHTYPADYRFYTEHHVEGVFTEHEYPVLADMRDFKVWMMMKLLEDPYRNYTALVKDFTDGFYGPAGQPIREYLKSLEAASAKHISYLSMGASPPQYRYLTLGFIRSAHRLFDRAEAKAAGNSTLLRRVRHARLPLDRATLVLFPGLVNEWRAAGRPPESFPLNRDAIARRVKNTWYVQADFRNQPGEKAQADAEIAALTLRPVSLPLPEQFRGLPKGSVFDYTADIMRNWQNIARVVKDSEAESGIADRLELSDADMEKYRLPMPWGLYDQIDKKDASSAIRPEDVPGPGYHWYRLGTHKIVPSHYLYFFWSWIIQVDVDRAFDPKNLDQAFEVWARIKFEGPGFPHGKAGDQNAISVERVVIVKRE